MKRKRDPNVDERGDFVLRWMIDAPKKLPPGQDPFGSFIHDLLKELLDIVALNYRGQDVRVDGFHFLNSGQIHKLYK